MADQNTKTSRFQSFASLNWYDGVIEFLFRFVAKTSEPLLAIGIVYSAADVLSKGHLGSTNQNLADLWAISQALAIEASGGVVLVYGLQSVKEKDYVKAWLYLTLSALLAFTGGIMLFMQLARWENQQGDSPFMLFLFGLRCVVSVGYIYLCRTKHISFTSLNSGSEPAPIQPTVPAHPQASGTEQIDYQRLAKELAPFLQAVRTTIIEEVRVTIAAPAIEAKTSATDRNGAPQMALLIEAQDVEPAPEVSSGATGAAPLVSASFVHDKVPEQSGNAKKIAPEEGTNGAQESGREPAPNMSARTSATHEEKLEVAYQELLREGKRVSGRALAERARVHRTTCTKWLKVHHPEHEDANAATKGEAGATRDSELESNDGADTERQSIESMPGESVSANKEVPEPEPDFSAIQEPTLGEEPEVSATEPMLSSSADSEAPEPEITEDNGTQSE